MRPGKARRRASQMKILFGFIKRHHTSYHVIISRAPELAVLGQVWWSWQWSAGQGLGGRIARLLIHQCPCPAVRWRRGIETFLPAAMSSYKSSLIRRLSSVLLGDIPKGTVSYVLRSMR